ncbi:hypothetical protein EV421DRAFT_1109600 [Armillaria borealis]|uniref:Uncharacterized protein n=1 Tax=Armillaria borealis TaxID=47425 RepID=A0AA39J5K8_9AGAR|nr:hypothetical protein EV421DRAFT_1109600 [Armillaria borealis]
MTDIPNAQEEVLEILLLHGALQSWIFDPPKRTATARYLDMHQAFQARFTVSNQCFFFLILFFLLLQALVDLKSNGISAFFLTNPGGYIFPEWFPAEEAAQGIVNCRIQSPGVRCRGICGTTSIGNSVGSRHDDSNRIRLVTALQLDSVFPNESPEMILTGCQRRAFAT